MSGRSFALILVALSLVYGQAWAAQGQADASRRPDASADPTLVVQSGTVIPLEIKNTINSRTAYVGESVYAESIYPVTDGDRLLIPAHSYVKGSVTDVVRPGRIKGKALLSLRFDSLTMPNGTTRPLQARVYSIAGCRLGDSKASEEAAEQAGSGETASAAKDAVIDAGGLPGGSALSAASQGVGGIVLMLVTRGKTIILRPGTTLEIQLTFPVDFGPTGPNQSAAQVKSPTLARRPASNNHRKSEAPSRQRTERQ